jgi:hypothetical protein
MGMKAAATGDAPLQVRQLAAGDQVGAGHRLLPVLHISHAGEEADSSADGFLVLVPLLAERLAEVLAAVGFVGRRLPQAAQAPRVGGHARLPADEGVEVRGVDVGQRVFGEPGGVAGVVPARPGVGHAGDRIGPQALEERGLARGSGRPRWVRRPAAS